MTRANEEVSALLQEYADLLSITGGESFKVRAYEKAARAIGGHHTDVSTLDSKQLRAIPDVGKSIADKITEYCHRGGVHALEDLRTKVPAGVRRLTEIPTLGPRKAMLLYEDLGIRSVPDLEEAIEQHRLRELKGFGPKTEENIQHGIALLRQADDRVHLDVAAGLAEEIVGKLSSVRGCLRCACAGSLRRFRETIGDIDVLAAADHPEPVMTAFANLPVVTEVIARGGKKTSVRTTKGLQVDLRVVPPHSWGAALQYFTGSKAHNIRLRELAVHKNLKLSEYGLFDADTEDLVVSETEEEVYRRLGLPWIPPPLREDRGEIDAALHDELPDLVTDVRGDLHTHTNLTDGLCDLEEMVAAAAKQKYAYYAITDHAPDLAVHRMSKDKILAQRKHLRHLDRTRPRVLHGVELNIGPDGDVDWPADFLSGFDLCVASVHSHFTQPKQQMTRRLVRACENPHVHIIGHPTARLIGKRPPVDADFDEVFRACARTGTALEINAHPDRLDLCDTDILRAKRFGVKFAINSDAHAATHLGYMRFGIGTAQRGWLTPNDVINTWPLRRLRTFLRQTAGYSPNEP